MLIKFGAIVVGGRGKLGGQVFSHNRGGDYMRNNAVPTNPRTVFQQATRAILTQLSQGWSGLTASQIRAWNSATENFKRTNVFGDLRKLNGKNLYTSLNKNLVQVGESVLTDPPNPDNIVAPIEVSAEIKITATKIDLGDAYEGVATPSHIVIRATPPVSQGTSFVKNDLRVVSAGQYATVTDEEALWTAYVARFGAPVQADKIFFSAYSVNASGQKSTEVIGVAKMTA